MAKEDMGKPHKMWGVKMLVLGLLVLANAYWAFVEWPNFIGILLVLGGLWKLVCCRKK